MDQALKDKFLAIVGEANFSDSLIDLVSFSYDASEHVHRPEAGLWPTSTEQVSQIMALANANQVSVTPRGAGTGLAGSAVPLKGGIVLDLSKMNKIKEIRLEDRQVVVQPGVVYADLQAALAPHGFFYPPDPASGKAATLGGNVATNAGGLKGAKYGVTKHYVLGLEVVLADGSVLKTGSSCLKCVSGYDLTALFVGSEGTLGVVTEIIFKILPEPTEKSTCMATFAKLGEAGQAIAGIMAAKAVPCVLEILDKDCIAGLNKYADLGLPQAEALLLAEADGFTPGEAELHIERIAEVMRENNAIEVTKAANREEAEAMWTARRSIAGIIFAIKGSLIAEDITVPPSKIKDLLEGVHQVSQDYDLMIPTLGHVGDGNLHPNLLYDKTDQEECARVEKAAGALFKLATDLGGTLTGEHGIGLAKAPYFPLEHDPVSIGTMSLIKNALDPKNILNPGKMALP